METLLFEVAGLDVHKKFVMGCIRLTDRQTGVVREEIRRFSTMTDDLRALGDWLAGAKVTDVAMESTGVFWKPIWNILEGRFRLLLANPRELKQVPGRKSDVKDSQWIAHLLACGLLTPSFVPEQAQRDLRDLTRFRATLADERIRVVNRIHKVLEDTNIKLASVASNVLGVSGRDMLDALIAGQTDPGQLAELCGCLRKAAGIETCVARSRPAAPPVFDPTPAGPSGPFGRRDRSSERKGAGTHAPFLVGGSCHTVGRDSGDQSAND